ncbi:MAG: hypothetical protein ACKO23_13200 [Gemmataceae bacterium]
MPRQNATRLVGVRIPREHFTCIQAMAEVKGQDISTVLNELIFKGMPRLKRWLGSQIGVRMFAFRLALGSLEKSPSPSERDLLEYLVGMLPSRTSADEPLERKEERIHRVLNVVGDYHPSTSREPGDFSRENIAHFLLRCLNLEEDLYRRQTQTHRDKPGGPSTPSKKYRAGEKPSPGPT